MIKLVSSNDFDWSEIPLSLMKVASTGLDRGWLEKRAGVMCKEIADLRPEPGRTLVHVLAVGDTEKTGANRNGDGFSAHWNNLNHGYFTKHAHLFQNHKNHDPKLAVGGVKLSAYNPEMGRIELVLSLDNVKCAEAVNKLEKGEDIAVSMGCKVAHDVCSICGHKAPSPRDYCSHAKLAMGKVLEDGRQVYVDNPDPHYFDISLVPRPAERTAFSFRKVAGMAAATSSTVLFKEAGLMVPSYMVDERDSRALQKRALLQKLSEMEKEIEAKLTPVDQDLTKTFEEGGQLQPAGADKLQKAGLEGVLSQLADAKVTLPLKDFIRLISKEQRGHAEALVPEAEQALPGVFSRMHEDQDSCEECGFDGQAQGLPGGIHEILAPLIQAFGAGAPMQRRVTIAIIRGKSPGTLQKQANVKNPAAEGLARLYAHYKLALLTHPANLQDAVLTRLAVLQNYTRT